MVSLRGIARCSAAAGFLLGWSCLATVQAADGAAANYCTGRDVEARPAGGVQLAPQWKTILEKRFDGELGDWRINNYQKALIIEVADDPGLGRSLLVHRKGPENRHRLRDIEPRLGCRRGRPIPDDALGRLLVRPGHGQRKRRIPDADPMAGRCRT